MNKKTMTLEQYNKKYRNRTEYLIKLKKSDADAYNKKFEHVVGNQYLFNGRKWQLIGDTYYQIPRPISYTWFRNLHAGVQVATCALLGAIVVGGAATPLIINYLTNRMVVECNNPDVEISWKKEDDSIIVLVKPKVNGFKIESLKVYANSKNSNESNGEIPSSEYEYVESEGKITISKETIENRNIHKIILDINLAEIVVEQIVCQPVKWLDYNGNCQFEDMNIQILPENAYNKSCSASVEQEHSNYVEINGHTITATNNVPTEGGKVGITLTSKKVGTVSSTFEVNIKPKEPTYDYLTFTDSTNYPGTYAVSLNDSFTLTDNYDLFIPSKYKKDGETEYKEISEISMFGFYSLLYPQALKISSVNIPSTVKKINTSAFKDCTNLKTLVLDDSSELESIGGGAFDGCTALDYFTIPNSVKDIPSNAFNNCSNIKFYLESGCTNWVVSEDFSILFNGDKSKIICANSFNNESLDLSKCTNLIEIPSGAFKANKKIKTVSLPGSLKSISDNAFLGCSNLSSVTFGEGTKNIETFAFGSCPNLHNIVFPKSLEKIGTNAFSVTDTNTGLFTAKFLDSDSTWKITNNSSVIQNEYSVKNEGCYPSPETGTGSGNAFKLKYSTYGGFVTYLWEKNN